MRQKFSASRSRSALILLFIVTLMVIGLAWWKFVYGMPFMSFGESGDVKAVRSLDESYWSSKGLSGPVYVVARDDYAVAAYMGDAGISLTLYQRRHNRWVRRPSAVAADACSLRANGVPLGTAQDLSAHVFRAVPTIPFHAPCSEHRLSHSS